jgi:hypothetical protein
MLDLREHSIEGERELTHLGSGIALRHTTVEATFGDSGGSLLDFAQWLQAALDHPVASDAEDRNWRALDPRRDADAEEEVEE